MKKSIIVLIVVLLIGVVGVYFLIQSFSEGTEVTPDTEEEIADTTTPDQAVPSEDEEEEEANEAETVIGTSVNDNEITAYHYGEGDTQLLFVGGIHGGYAWNTVLVAYELMDYLEENLEAIPENVRVTVIPVLNPDGLNEVVGTTDRFEEDDVPSSEAETIAGRFNANTVDLNRNFDCDWEAKGTWQNREVSGGSEAFSEPESQAFRSYIESNEPDAVVVWYSAAGGVFASNCHEGVLPETRTLTNAYAKASGYRAYEEFNFYDITGDMVNWLAKEEIPAISVLLTTHDDVEWDENRAGIEALFDHFAE